jgi:mercuric reductase
MIGKSATKGTVLGGTCINVGCVPSKRLIAASSFMEELGQRRFNGLSYSIGKPDYARIMDEKTRLVDELRKEKYKDVLENLENVTYINETASFVDKDTIKAGRNEVNAESILVATGARASVPPIKGIEKSTYLTNEEALSLRKLPESIIVIGGRAIGLEFAQMFANFGVKVTLLQRSDRIIPNWEPEVSSHLASYLKASGVKLITGATPASIMTSKRNKVIEAMVNGRQTVFEAEEVLFATGRRANTESLKLDVVGVQLNAKGFIKVDKQLKTTADGIYAAGDVTGEPMLETLAAKEGNIATANLFQHAGKEVNINEVPSAIFTYPEAAMVGMTEEQVVKDGIRCACSPLEMKLVPKARIMGDQRGLVKIVIDNKTKKILGVHMLAPHAADMIHEGVLAVKFGLTIDDIIDTVHVFPTLSEGFKLAAQAFYEDVSKLSCCTA